MANQQIVMSDAPQSADDALDSYVDEILGEAPVEASEPEAIDPPEEVESEGEAPEIDATEEEQSEEAPEEETPEYITIRANGKDIELTYEEVIEHAQKGIDYFKKTTELAEQRKTFETERQQLQQEMQLRNALFTDIADLKALDNQLESYSKVNWDAWQDQDPVEAIKGWRRFQELQNSKQQKVSELQNKQQYISQQEAINRQQMIERGMAELKASIRDWTPERGAKLKEFGVETYGFTSDEMANVLDPRMVRVLNDAAKFRELQATKPAITKKVAEAPKNVKPGNTPKTDEKTQRAEAFKKLAQAKTRKGREAIADSLLDRFV
jgi:hypothetical protein